MTWEKISEIPKLREAIISYAIHKEDGASLSKNTVAACRLVSRDWRFTTSKCVSKSRKSLIWFAVPEHRLKRLTPANTPQLQKNQQQSNKTLAHFIQQVSGFTRIEDEPAIPFSLDAVPWFCPEDNYDIVFDCLNKCGKDLISLSLQLPLIVRSTQCVIPHKSLERLADLNLSWKPALTTSRNIETFNFIQNILNGARNLSIFCLKIKEKIDVSPQCLVLPETLTKIDLGFNLEDDDLQMLIKCPLPMLTYLRLYIPDKPFGENAMFECLTNVCKTLQVLALFWSVPFRRSTKLTLCNVRFPVMEKLKALEISRKYCHVSTNPNSTFLPENFPLLTNLRLHNQTMESLRSFTENIVFTSVKSLKISMTNKIQLEAHKKFQGRFTLEAMQLVLAALTHLEDLSVTLYAVDTECLKFLFLEQKRLKKLTLAVCNSDGIIHADLWDSLLTGMPIEVVSGIRKNPNISERIQFENEGLAAITNLTELRELNLYALIELESSLISDLAFRFAFLKMPQLQALNFYGRFMASPTMVKRWKDMGRQLFIKKE